MKERKKEKIKCNMKIPRNSLLLSVFYVLMAYLWGEKEQDEMRKGRREKVVPRRREICEPMT